MRRILFVIHHAVFSGPHNQALRLDRPLAARGWETVVVLPHENGNAADRLRGAGVCVEQAPIGRLRATLNPRAHVQLAWSFRREVESVRSLIQRLRIDLVLIGGLVNVQAALAARREGTPLVWQILDSRPPRVVRSALMPVVRRCADCVMFTGEGLIDQHGGRRRLPVPITVYFPPVDTELFHPSPARRGAVRASLGLDDDTVLIGTVANINPQKGIEYFLRAAARVHRANPRTAFVVVGSRYDSHRRYAAMIEAERRGSGIPASRLLFTGFRSDVECLLAAMDVKLITSVRRSEGVSTTALEAMACGLPVVATEVGALPEVVDEGVTGFTVPPEDSEALADATLRLAADPERRRRMGREARRRAVERFGVESCADVHARAFEIARARRLADPAATIA